MSELLCSGIGAVEFIGFLAAVFGVPGLIWMYFLWKSDQKAGRKWVR